MPQNNFGQNALKLRKKKTLEKLKILVFAHKNHVSLRKMPNFVRTLIFYSTFQRFQVFIFSKICFSFYFIIQQLRRTIRNRIDCYHPNCYMDDTVTYLNNVGVYN